MHSQAGVSQKFFYMVGCAKFLIIFPKFLSVFFQDFSNFIIEKISAMKILVVVMGGAAAPFPLKSMPGNMLLCLQSSYQSNYDDWELGLLGFAVASVSVFCQILTLQGGVTTSAQQKLKLGLSWA